MRGQFDPSVIISCQKRYLLLQTAPLKNFLLSPQASQTSDLVIRECRVEMENVEIYPHLFLKKLMRQIPAECLILSAKRGSNSFRPRDSICTHTHTHHYSTSCPRVPLSSMSTLRKRVVVLIISADR